MAEAPITRGDPTQPPMMGRMIPEFYECAITGEERVKIMYPGDQLREPHFMASLEYQVRFPVEWRAFKEQTDQFEGQTRIENVAWIDPASHNAFKALHIHTVEALANVDDTNIGNLGIMGARKLRERAVKSTSRPSARRRTTTACKPRSTRSKRSLRERRGSPEATKAPRQGREPRSWTATAPRPRRSAGTTHS